MRIRLNQEMFSFSRYVNDHQTSSPLLQHFTDSISTHVTKDTRICNLKYCLDYFNWMLHNAVISFQNNASIFLLQRFFFFFYLSKATFAFCQMTVEVHGQLG